MMYLVAIPFTTYAEWSRVVLLLLVAPGIQTPV
jgi:hypothetical protein